MYILFYFYYTLLKRCEGNEILNVLKACYYYFYYNYVVLKL